MDIKAESDAARTAARAVPLRSKIFSLFTFEVCMFLAAAIIFSVHYYLKISDEKLLNEGVAAQGVITKKTISTSRPGKNMRLAYIHHLHYRFNYQSREYADSNEVKQRLWDKVHEGDTILLAVDSDNPERSRIKSSDVIKGIIPALLFVSILPFAFGIISLVVSLFQKLLEKKIS
jgi:hypothetical protein